MSRGLDAAIVTQLESNKITSAYLIELIVESGIVYLTSYPRTISFGGNTYVSASTLGIDGINDNLTLQNNEVSVSLSGISPTYASLVLNEEYIGNDLTVRLFFYNENTGAFIADPYIVHKGPVSESNFNRDIGNGTVTISLNVGTWFARFDDINGPRTNPTEWKVNNPSDEVFQQVPTLQEKELLF